MCALDFEPDVFYRGSGPGLATHPGGVARLSISSHGEMDGDAGSSSLPCVGNHAKGLGARLE